MYFNCFFFQIIISIDLTKKNLLDGYWQEPKCGRPLGIEFDKSGILYVADAYYGIWKVNIATGQKQLLVSPSVEIEGRKPKVFNSIALASNGDVYWTDSSSDIYLEDGIFGMLLDGSGRQVYTLFNVSVTY